MIFRTTIILLISLLSIDTAAQVARINTEDVMDSVFDMSRHAAAADKLSPEGSRYCRWGADEFDASDFDVAVSRLLLNHGSKVPDNLPASKMWRVSLLARDIANQLAMGTSMCYLRLRASDEARRTGLAASSLYSKLMLARSKFNGFAYQQTQWQDQSEGSKTRVKNEEGNGKVATKEILEASIAMREAAQREANFAIQSQTTPGCIHSNSAETIDWSDLSKLIDYMKRVSGSPSTIPSANMWGVAIEAEVAEVSILWTHQNCLPYASEKKQALRLATDAGEGYHRLRVAVTAFEALSLRQTEWEERGITEKQGIIQEQ